MLFTQPIFLIYFALVFCLHWTIQRNSARKVMLLAASYVFYAGWDWRFLILIAASTIIDFAVGLILRAPRPVLNRKVWLVLSLSANLGILGVFKYFNFFVESAHGLLTAVGVTLEARMFGIVLPVGISFFTFQSMSYTIDVYRGRIKPVRSFTDFALFVAFFPQLVAGPIVRAATFLPQLAIRRRLSDVMFKGPIALFLTGFIKKVCIADNLAPVVDSVFADPGAFDVVSIWIAVLFYAAQIYCDFSGYTDMAIAVARLLGYELCLNFSFPYFASNIQEFWRRWHISLSTWLRDYLYISLGGNRGSKLFAMRNLMLTMLLGGFWHGASWNFVVWGGLHGFALVVHRIYQETVGGNRYVAGLMKMFGIVLTFYWVCLTWIFFRATNFADAYTCLKAFVIFQSPGQATLGPELLWWLPPMILAHWIMYRRPIEERVEQVPNWACAIGYGLATFFALLFLRFGYSQFIYFQF